MTFERIESRPVNFVECVISVEDGCNVEDEEYSLAITGIIGSIDINAVGGVDDVTLIKEAISDGIPIEKYPKNGTMHIVLEESGEWEDVLWHKYYILKRFCITEY